ncbi:MAG: 2-oxoglutarate dehydrogenase complex dihydrolipoyllysine-residue succinyltransferase [Bdellovibrionaceae bacterium]|nr:2-oxoglutarate dehydrogenase complex dihydrolipoyllysine-residue succinyltransferase [Pseudobdellovibrionaceae bacterium]MBX3032310.1 2-oxoglutarate dehydrogenase complex dihydrolipoyllysine-residue succinyltransferase [Pseudobdellovibrionaceae bacterium]
MKLEVKVPAVGESITEATIGSWEKKSGDFVKRNDVLLLLETDKASVEVVAEQDGVLTTQAEAGQTVQIGSTIGTIDTDAKAAAGAPAGGGDTKTKAGSDPGPAIAKKDESKQPAGAESGRAPQSGEAAQHLSPAVQRLVTETGADPAKIAGTGKDGRLTKGDVLAANAGGGSLQTTTPAKEKPASAKPAAEPMFPGGSARASKQGEKKLVPMTTIRKRIAERLVEAKNTTAMLTTFNEIDMSRVMDLRNKYKDKFKEKNGINLGFMGFFVKAAVEALKAFPAVNAYIAGTDVEYHNYFNLGIAVSTDRGLMVPVIRDVDQMSIAEIEMAIRDYAAKARDGKIGVDDLQGGTFTITNGGVFGSLMSTPILNSPQSAILGMHKIQERPIAVDGQVVVRPMMYVALSYDHRIIDGKESVSFLVKIKEGVEDPERLLLEI